MTLKHPPPWHLWKENRPSHLLLPFSLLNVLFQLPPCKCPPYPLLLTCLSRSPPPWQGPLWGAPRDPDLRRDFWKSLPFASHLDSGHGINLKVLPSGRFKPALQTMWSWSLNFWAEAPESRRGWQADKLGGQFIAPGRLAGEIKIGLAKLLNVFSGKGIKICFCQKSPLVTSVILITFFGIVKSPEPENSFNSKQK